MPELVSCVMPTYNRPQYLPMALRLFARQTWPNLEMIVVDDSEDESVHLPAGMTYNSPDGRIRVLRLADRATIGTKLNIGIAAARGLIIQKWDDDDWYSPDFVSVMAPRAIGDPKAICALSDFLILTKERELKYSGQGWAAGGTLCFHKSIWEQAKFRETSESIADYDFFRDHPRAHRPVMVGPERYMLVRHEGAHRWQNIRGVKADDFFSSLRPYKKPLHGFLSAADLKFYQEVG